MGRDKSKAQLMSDIIGKRVVAAISRRLPKSHVYLRKSDRVIIVDRQMMARTGWHEGVAGGSVHANLLEKIGLIKSELVDEVEAAAPPGAGSVRWET